MDQATTCPVCGQDFIPQPLRGSPQTYCGATCQRKAQYARKKAKGAEPRRCPTCGEVKPGSEYSGGTFAYCKPCAAAWARARRLQGGAEQRAMWSRMETLRRYGLTIPDFEEMVRSQGGRCAICKTNAPGGSGVWHVDHDHTCCPTRKASCGKCLRGLLCSRCNIGLGNFGDDPTVLDQAAEYIRRYQTTRASGLPMP